MKNKLLYLLLALMCCIPFALGDLVTTYTDYTNQSAFASVNTATYRAMFPVSPNITFLTLNSVKPNSTNIVTYNQTITGMVEVGGYVSLTVYSVTDNSTVQVRNLTDGTIVQQTGNWTVTNTTPLIYIFSITNNTWNNSNLSVLYNRTYTSSDDIYSNAAAICGAGCALVSVNASGYGATTGWKLATSAVGGSLNGTDWIANWSYRQGIISDGPVRVNCLATKTAIYGGFALIAVALIVLGAFGIINIFSGNAGVESMMAIAISIIGIAIAVLIGYYLIGGLSSVVCSLVG